MVRQRLSLTPNGRGPWRRWACGVTAAVIAVGCGWVVGGCGSGADNSPSLSGSLLTNVSETAVETPTRAEPAKTLPLHRLTAAPVLDGKLDDPCWTDAAAADSFTAIPTSGKAASEESIQPTTCALGFDDTALYLAFQCAENKPDRLAAQATDRDGAVFADDAVEMQFDLNGLRRNFLRLAVNSKGTQYDAKGQRTPDGIAWDTGWNPQWQAAARKTPTGWTAEVAIPLSALGWPSLPEGMRLDVALLRHEQPHQELSTWCVSPPSAAEPEAEAKAEGERDTRPAERVAVGFGELILGEAPYVVTLLSPGELAWGQNSGKLTLTQTGDKSEPLDVKTEFTGGEKVGVGDVVTVMPTADKPRKVDFRYEVEQKHGAGEVVLSVTGRSTHELFYYAPLPFQLDTLLSVSLPQSELPTSTKTVVAAVRVNVAKESRADLRVKVSMAAKDTPNTALTSGTLTAPAAAAEVTLDLSSLSVGEYLLKAALKDRDGNVLDQVQQPLRLVGPDTPSDTAKTRPPG